MIVVLLASGLVPGAAVWALTSSIAPTYESSAEIAYRFPDIAPSTRTVLGLRAGGDFPDALLPATSLGSELERAAQRRIGARDADGGPRSVRFTTTITPPGLVPREQGVLVAAQARTATDASRLANAYATEYVKLRERSIEARFAQLTNLFRSLQQVLSGRDRSSAAAAAEDFELASQLEVLERSNASIRRRASAAPSRIAPHAWRNTAVMVAIGVIAALAFGLPQRLEGFAGPASQRR